MKKIYIFGILLLILFVLYTTKKIKKENKKITLYYTNWCSHCSEFKPIWFKLKNKLSIPAYEVDCSYMENPPVNKFPTIMLEMGNNKIEYIGDRNTDSILNFANN